MANLFLDTGHFLTLGLLDDCYQWLDYKIIYQQKNSQIIHQQIYQLLQSHNYTLSQMQQVFTIAGPGSYTGVRLAAGITQILELVENLQVFSFYHFQVPQLLGMGEGIWMCPAFKGEYFFFNCGSGCGQTLALSAALELLLGQKADCHFYAANPDVRRELGRELGGEEFWQRRPLRDTSVLIHDNSAAFFSQVSFQQLRLAPFYFRPEEKEFSLPRSPMFAGKGKALS